MITVRLVAVLLVGIVLLPPATASAAAQCFGQAATIMGSGTITGTPGDDVIIGSDVADTIFSGDGTDFICSLGGDDQVNPTGGPISQSTGILWASGGPGNDLMVGAYSKDAHLFGDAGNDTLFGGASIGVTVIQHLDGGDGDDVLEQGDVLDGSMTAELIGGAGDDRFPHSGATNSTLDLTIAGGSGNDIIELPTVEMTVLSLVVQGGTDDDTVAPNASYAPPAPGSTITSAIDGGPGDDILFGLSGDGSSEIDNTLRGRSGTDALTGGDGVGVTNRFDGGGGRNDVCTPGIDSENLVRRCS